MAAASGAKVPAFARILGRSARRPRDALALGLGGVLVVLVALSVAAALGLAFDPRYRDFPFAPLTGAVVPFLLLANWELRLKAGRPAAEIAAAATLAVSAIYIAANEGVANWQALWFAGGLFALALTLLQARDAPD
jgi:glucan 1,3-beta-glucosidase